MPSLSHLHRGDPGELSQRMHVRRGHVMNPLGIRSNGHGDRMMDSSQRKWTGISIMPEERPGWQASPQEHCCSDCNCCTVAKGPLVLSKGKLDNEDNRRVPRHLRHTNNFTPIWACSGGRREERQYINPQEPITFRHGSQLSLLPPNPPSVPFPSALVPSISSKE